MVSLSLLEEIERYLLLEKSKLEGDEFEKEAVPESDTQYVFVKQFISDLIRGENTANNKSLIFNILDIPADEKKMFLAAVNDEKLSDADLLVMVLENCDEEVLNKLTVEFGERSRITRLINDKIKRSHLAAHQKGTHDIEQSIERILHENEKSGSNFYFLLSRYLERRGFKTDSSFYNYIGMSRQTFARIRDKSKSLSKQNILLMIVGLKLNYSEAVSFLQEFGYSFKNSDKRDVIIQYILKNAEYDLNMVNEILYQFGVKTLIET